MATPEAKSSHQVRTRASAWGIRLFRNNSGVLMNQVGVPVRFGLGNESPRINKELKSGDFIGWMPMTITPEMVNKTVAVFVNLEAKAKGFTHRETYNKNSREYGQDNFNKMVENANGVSGFATGSSDVDMIINEFLDRIKQ